MKYYIDGENKRAILKIWNSKNKLYKFRIEELLNGKITIRKVIMNN